MIVYEISICIVLTLIIQKYLKVCLVKLHDLTQIETEEWNCIELLSMKMLSVLFLSMCRYRLNMNERQDRGASSHREIIAEHAPTYAFTPFFLTLIFYKNNLNSEHLFCKSF